MRLFNLHAWREMFSQEPRTVSANAYVDRIGFAQGVLVKHRITGEIGIVTLVTSKWVHVTWLAASGHENNHFKRDVLTICEPGTKVVVKQR